MSALRPDLSIVPSDAPAALADLRVVELGDRGTQYCGKLLADLGAEVIKVEPRGGVPSRHIGPFRNDIPDPNQSLLFWAFNTNKRSVVVDLDQTAGPAQLGRLLESADILIEDTRPGYLASLGLGYPELSRVNPRLIYTSITPFGQTGPLADWKGGDLIQWAMGGNMWLVGYDDPTTTPILPGGGLSWLAGGHWGAIGTLMALEYRHRTGEGQQVDISVQEACCLATEHSVPAFEYMTQVVHRHDYHNLIKCADGKYFYAQFTNVGSDVWQRLTAWLEELDMAEELSEDRFLIPEVLAQSFPRVIEILSKVAATRTTDEMWRKGQSFGLTWMVVNAPDDLIEDEQLLARNFYQQVEHPELGATFTYPGPPYLWSETPWRIRRRAPLLGEDNALLSEISRA